MTDYNARLATYQQALAGQADLAFLPISSDLQYLTGIPRDLPNFGAVLHPGAWLEGAWLTPSAGPLLTITRMSAEVGSLTRLKDADVRILGDHDDPAVLARSVLDGLDLPDSPTVAVSNFAEAETMIHIQRLLAGATFTSATDLLRPQRAIKSDEELALLRKAGQITEAAFGATLPNLFHGMTELDVISEVNYQLRRRGSLGESFVTTMYNSGPNLPLKFGERLETQARRLEPPVTLLFDFGAICEGYCYDFGRTVFFGEPTPEMERIYELVMASQRAGIAALKAGEVTAAEVDAAARQVIEDGGYGEAFRHRLGHGIGLDVHEPPFLTASDQTVLQAGMCFTVEPSITRYDGFSARVEDIVVVRPGGGEPLTRGFQSLHVVG